MAKVVRSHAEPLDLLVWRHFRRTTGGLVEATLALNPFLREYGAVLPSGLMIALPDPPAATLPPAVIKLWD